MISERTIAALAAAKARGVRLGNQTNLPDAQAAGHRTMMQDADDHAARWSGQFGILFEAVHSAFTRLPTR
ncbi:MAG: hypothetical protein WCO00_14870 [Rhodospirillaceae bacterium]